MPQFYHSVFYYKNGRSLCVMGEISPDKDCTCEIYDEEGKMIGLSTMSWDDLWENQVDHIDFKD